MKKLFLILIMLVITSYSNAQWTAKTPFGGTIRSNAVGFSIGTKGYIGTGTINLSGSTTNDFWEWNQATNIWTQKANFPGGNRTDEIAFSIGTKGYIGLGDSATYYTYHDLWEYNQATDTWTKKANFPGTTSTGAAGFSIGSKGYVLDEYYNFWEYNPATDTWTKKANFPGCNAFQATGFSIGTKGYIGTGIYLGGANCNDFWEWDQTTDTWTEKADYPVVNIGHASGFSIGTKGYIGTGECIDSGNLTKVFHVWDQATNTWSTIGSVGYGTISGYAVGFSIGTKGYIGTGNNGYGTLLKEFYELTTVVGIGEIAEGSDFNIYPNPATKIIVIEYLQKATIEISNINGQIIKTIIHDSGKSLVDIGDLSSGVYIIKARTDKEIVTKKIIKQ